MNSKPAVVSPQAGHLGAALREFRRRSGMTQEELALRANLHTTVVSRVERGRVEPGMRTIQRLARGLDLPLAALVDAAERREVEAAKRESQAA